MLVNKEYEEHDLLANEYLIVMDAGGIGNDKNLDKNAPTPYLRDTLLSGSNKLVIKNTLNKKIKLKGRLSIPRAHGKLLIKWQTQTGTVAAPFTGAGVLVQHEGEILEFDIESYGDITIENTHDFIESFGFDFRIAYEENINTVNDQSFFPFTFGDNNILTIKNITNHLGSW